MSEPSSLAGAIERGAYWQTRALQAEGQVAAIRARTLAEVEEALRAEANRPERNPAWRLPLNWAADFVASLRRKP